MLDHHIQKAIVYRLAFSPSLRFSDLKPDGIENKLFDYHLKKVVTAGFVQKDADGLYKLTSKGRKLGFNSLNNGRVLIDQAYTVLFLAVRRAEDKAWLLYKRNTHPLRDRVGFMHAEPAPGLSVEQAASLSCLRKTGIKANFRPLGSGFFTTYEDDDLEGYVNFTFLVCDDAKGELLQNDPLNEYFWVDNPDFTDDNMLPNMKTLGNLHKANKLFFVEKTFNI